MGRLQRVKSMLLAMQRYPWEQGVAAQAFLESGDGETAVILAREAAHRQAADGRPAMLGGEDTVTDPCANGEALCFAYGRTKDPLFLKAMDALKAWALETAPRAKNGTVYHVNTRPEFWVDSFYMLPPYLAAIGETAEAVRQVNGYWEALFMPGKGLLGHIYNDGEKRWVRSAAWGVGNGWAMAGMARVAASLPGDMDGEKAVLAGRIKLLLDSALKLQRGDGLFHDVLDDVETFVETNFAQMAAYTIYRGVAAGWLDASYLEPADKMRSAAAAKVDKYGMVAGVCGAPDFTGAGYAPEGQAFYILMEAAYRDYHANNR